METINEVPDLTGKVVLVTGANSGLGYETVRALSAKGARLIMACRNLEKANAAAKQLRPDNPAVKLRVMELDLSSLISVRTFAEAFTKQYDQLDILCNNAGVMALPERFETVDGFEMQFGTNHLGHFALTGLLLPIIKATPNARVVTVSSMAHKMGIVDFDNLNAENGYKRWQVYGFTKLANLLFTYELQQRFESAGINAIATAAHPGWTATNLQKHSSLFSFLNNFLAQQQPMGALPTIRAATSADVQGGDYYGPNKWGGWRGYPEKVESNEASHDQTVAKQLWEVSEKLTAVQYNFET